MDCVRKNVRKYWCCTRQATKPQHLCDLEPGEEQLGDGDKEIGLRKRYAFRLPDALTRCVCIWRAELFYGGVMVEDVYPAVREGGCHRDALSKLRDALS